MPKVAKSTSTTPLFKGRLPLLDRPTGERSNKQWLGRPTLPSPLHSPMKLIYELSHEAYTKRDGASVDVDLRITTDYRCAHPCIKPCLFRMACRSVGC